MRRVATWGRNTALIAAGALAFTLGAATGAQAADSGVEGTAAAIEQVAPQVDTLAVERAPDGTYSAGGEGAEYLVEAPRTTAGTLELSSEAGAALGIGLPDVAAGSAKAASDGTVVYEGATVDVALQALDNGVRVQTVVAGASAPTRFAYDLGSAVPFLYADGSVVIVSGENLVQVQVPWAFDANGTPVATHYEVDGGTLVQVVDHTARDVAYPVVADPTFIAGTNWFFGGPYVAVRFNRSETSRIGAGAAAVAAAATIVSYFTKQFPEVAGASAVVGLTAAAVTVWAKGAEAVGKCVEVRLYPKGAAGRAAVYPLWWGC